MAIVCVRATVTNPFKDISLHEFCSAMRVVELSIFTIWEAFAVQLGHVSHRLQKRVGLVGAAGSEYQTMP